VIRPVPYVKARDNEPGDRLLRRFQKACEKAGLMAEIRRRQWYEKPSQTRKREENTARRKLRKLRRIMERR